MSWLALLSCYVLVSSHIARMLLSLYSRIPSSSITIWVLISSFISLSAKILLLFWVDCNWPWNFMFSDIKALLVIIIILVFIEVLCFSGFFNIQLLPIRIILLFHLLNGYIEHYRANRFFFIFLFVVVFEHEPISNVVLRKHQVKYCRTYFLFSFQKLLVI